MRAVISVFADQLKLAEKAAEDIYFARLDRQLIESLHKRMQHERHSRPMQVQGGETHPGR